MKWRTIAIIFIVLFAIETILVVGVFSAGRIHIKNEQHCAINICSNIRDATSYSYSHPDRMCVCSDSGEVIYQEVLI
jgi:hypothetical protein